MCNTRQLNMAWKKSRNLRILFGLVIGAMVLVFLADAFCPSGIEEREGDDVEKVIGRVLNHERSTARTAAFAVLPSGPDTWMCGCKAAAALNPGERLTRWIGPGEEWVTPLRI